MGASVATLAMFTFIVIIGALDLAYGLSDANQPQTLFGTVLVIIGIIALVIAVVSGRRA